MERLVPMTSIEVCPCGSLKPASECCEPHKSASGSSVSLVRVRAPPQKLIEQIQQEEQRRRQFGEIRKAIQADFRGQKVVVVGNQILHSPNWKTPSDFLFD